MRILQFLETDRGDLKKENDIVINGVTWSVIEYITPDSKFYYKPKKKKYLISVFRHID